ncbi:TonB-dependent receptor [Arenibacter aquaticus]|uniref:TonB-dependent receptor n=1 Tax=Arenibacter aquaticus TaxID=2489054 RepID=A0A3S0CQ51_9FLAO|nr:TonB-dependent receptor [Arenibacter aquaticus]RTE54643.1 TonB-dependent receptor [Arenibacter aquaticus]
MMCCTFGFSQSINFDQLGKEKLLRYNGGISTSAVLYDGTANRQSFTYFLSGSLNFNIGGIYSIPLSFTYSNQDFAFPNPFKFNRLSLHPSYKWATAHIGDVNMTFSPYTLSGHQFSGAGFDLNPEGKFKISAMYGRFLKATEYNTEEPRALTAYKRIGYGIKTAYDLDFMKVGIILFKASDDENSLENPFPIELGLTPKDNAVLSFESEIRLLDKAQIRIEYAISGVTEDARLTVAPASNGILSFMLNENISTNYYKALSASFSYPAGKGTVGAGYERIDPEYKTLGAYYFNNDLENITLNASQTLLNNKVNLSINAGLQQDNLDNAKKSDQQRIVSAINLNYTASERLGINAGYSNFQTYTNIRDQFDYINQVGKFDNIDTLNYRQISQNANLGINYILKKTENKQHSANLNLVYQNSNNQQEGEIIEGGNNAFYNGMAGYTLGYPKQNLTVSLAANTSYNTIGESDNNLTLGPTLAVGKQFIDKQLRTNLSTSYNTSYANGQQQNNIYNFRLSSNYALFEKHNLSLNFLALFRNSSLNTGRDLTITVGYNYTFDNFNLNLELEGRTQRANTNPLGISTNTLSFRYRNVTYSGTIPELNRQLSNVFQSTQFDNIPLFKNNELTLLLALVKDQKQEQPYKENAIIFLKELYSFEDFLATFNNALFSVIQKIKLDMHNIDLTLENSFVDSKVKVDAHPLNKKDEEIEATEEERSAFNTLLAEREERLQKLVGHRWMQRIFIEFKSIDVVQKPEGFLKEFKQWASIKSFEIFDQTKDLSELKDYIENKIIDFYYKKSLGNVSPDDFKLKYINKN